jgi:hypothetical protein
VNSRPLAVFDRAQLLARQFPTESRTWDARQSVSWARDFGAGLAGDLAICDARFLDSSQPWALPMVAVPLCDGEFWQQRDDTGIHWQQIVHAEELLTLHRPLPMAGEARLSQRVTDIRDRGPGKGASMQQRMTLEGRDGMPYAEVDVTTVLLGNGGCGGPAPEPRSLLPLPEREPDVSVQIRTPSADATSFCLAAGLQVGAGFKLQPGQRVLRGVGCFGLAGRAALGLAAGNDPLRLWRFGVRYAGPLLSDETMLFELWRIAPGEAVFRMRAAERDAAVLSRGILEWKD